MKESIVKAITAIICVIVLCVTSSVAVSDYSDAVTEAAKLTPNTVSGASSDISADTPTDESVDTPTDEPTQESADESVDGRDRKSVV